MFTQADLAAVQASPDPKAAMKALLQREIDGGFIKGSDLPPNYALNSSGQVQVAPDPWLLKYGWLLPLGAEAAGPLVGALAGSGGPEAMTGPTLAQASGAAGSSGAAGAGAAATKAGGMTTSDWLDLFKVGSGLLGNIYGANAQSSAADQAASITAAAEKYIADLTAKSNADALAFNKSTAENAFQNNEVGRQTTYGQWAAKEGRLGYLGDLMGLPARQIPSYIPGVDPHFDGSTSGAPPAPAANYNPLMAAINAGQNPQAVIDSFNKSQGLPTGASYAWRAIPGAPGGGVVEIPGGSYLAPGSDGKWGWNVGDSGGSGAPAAAPQAASMWQPYVAPPTRPFLPTTQVPVYPGMFA